ncbi:hypothetical protein BpHYR1_012916 [Brachionus plicatilis]|uniref:Uncharacterized protein n=1 Tax=Brachionus plicatilis TaxID=10195 RepID=A0A3M7P8A5_BRAPC|nr:hypothetical protein BpHYR1_012916 [Brachionus plicatilis]
MHLPKFFANSDTQKDKIEQVVVINFLFLKLHSKHFLNLLHKFSKEILAGKFNVAINKIQILRENRRINFNLKLNPLARCDETDLKEDRDLTPMESDQNGEDESQGTLFDIFRVDFCCAFCSSLVDSVLFSLVFDSWSADFSFTGSCFGVSSFAGSSFGVSTFAGSSLAISSCGGSNFVFNNLTLSRILFKLAPAN